ncbi:MAG: serine/threonine protein kinase, partial [Planctomycetes bacterium]|nr:serine/threonine protein kinase [Planctomycetota bacterium]
MGSGAMGRVFSARAPSGELVAVKLLRWMIQNEDTERRFRREVESLERVEHPTIARILDNGWDGDVPYHVTEFVHGANLLEHVRERDMPRQERLALLLRIARGIAHAHERGVVHRDLKPSNILVQRDGQPKVVDFGIAMQFCHDEESDDANQHLTDSRQVLGTPGYMAPEQAICHRSGIGPWTDVYALGVLLYELVSGKRPHDTRELCPTQGAQLIAKHEPISLDRLAAVPPALGAVAAKAVARVASQRYQNAGDFAADLARYLDGKPVDARLPSFPTRVWRKVRQNRIVASLCALLALCGLALTWAIASERAARSAQHEREALHDDAIDTAHAGYEAIRELVKRMPTGNAIDVVRSFLVRTEPLAAPGSVPRIDRIRARLQGDLAALLVREKRIDEALPLRQRALDYWQQTCATDPSDAHRSRLSIALVEWGDLELARGHRDLARDFYERALEIDVSLAKKNAESRSFRDNLIWSYIRFGDLACDANDYGVAAKHYLDAHSEARALAAARPNCAATLWSLANSHQRLAKLTCCESSLEDLFAHHLSRAMDALRRHRERTVYSEDKLKAIAWITFEYSILLC